MNISRTPYRISIFGGGADYPGWYLKHGNRRILNGFKELSKVEEKGK